jgi:hypothetical protein
VLFSLVNWLVMLAGWLAPSPPVVCSLVWLFWSCLLCSGGLLRPSQDSEIKKGPSSFPPCLNKSLLSRLLAWPHGNKRHSSVLVARLLAGEINNWKLEVVLIFPPEFGMGVLFLIPWPRCVAVVGS